jgi:hypothetical protein
VGCFGVILVNWSGAGVAAVIAKLGKPPAWAREQRPDSQPCASRSFTRCRSQLLSTTSTSSFSLEQSPPLYRLHVMTRDSPRLVDEQDGEAEIFSALWAAAPSFPQLPPDATAELRALTVDVEDPKKVYAIYHGSRRHGFQVLVERF